jgi:uncharacterized protein
MIKEISSRVLPKIAATENLLREYAAKELGYPVNRIYAVKILKRSIDARQRTIFVNLQLRVFVDEKPEPTKIIQPLYQDVSQAKKQVIVVGAGPAGLFAALRLLELGVKPIVIERGKEVSERKKDIALISTSHKVDGDSNYCFGEGGAGAFSDGKLYTRSKKRGSVDKILEVLCLHGASESILIDAHPHIGTDKLPNVIKNMRERIRSCGGEVHFETRMVDLLIQQNEIKGITTNTQQTFLGNVILATGHSARDVYQLLKQKEIAIEAKGIAVGVRLEHPQALIDQLQYHSNDGRGEYLPAAEYSYVTQVADRGVYSFCMCPGGFVVPSASAPNQVVVNGMSPSSRGSVWANAGMVVEIRPEDLPEYADYKEFSLMQFQEEMENLAYVNGGSKQTAPAQRMTDYVRKKVSYDLPTSSYTPGVVSSPIHFWMPEQVNERLREGLKTFGRWSNGFLTPEALILGVETRTSSPVRVLRNKETYEHITIKGLYPCGEGAGYAGGIVSAAIDGERCAESVALRD